MSSYTDSIRNIFGLANTISTKKSSPPLNPDSATTVKGFKSPSTEEPVTESHSETLTNMASLKKNMQHIDRKELYTNLEARVKYLHSFLDFNSEDRAALVLGSKYIKALIPAVVNIVYKKLLSYDITARAFTTRSTSYEGPIDEFPEEDSPQIKYRKMFLRGYLSKICSDPSKLEFWEYMDKVGLMHVGQGRKHPLHVEYIHIGVLLGFIQDILIEAVLSHPRLKIEQKTAIVKALGKVLWIQNDLFAKWYVRDGDEFAEQKPEVEIEGEGMLHGKRVVASEEEGCEGGCPFSGAGASSGLGVEECAGKKSGGTCPVTGSHGVEAVPVPTVRPHVKIEETA